VCGCMCYYVQGSHASWKVQDFFLENSRTWKVLEIEVKVLESPGKISLKITHFYWF